MWCRNVRSQLSAYADGELTPAMTQQVRAHLAGCDRCTQEFAGLRSLAALTAAVPLEDVPSALHQRILASLNHAAMTPEPMPMRPMHRSVVPRTWAWAAFATGVVAVACGALQQRPGNTPDLSTRLLAADVTPTAKASDRVATHRATAAEAPKRADQHETAPETSVAMVEAQVEEAPATDKVAEVEATAVAATQSASVPTSKPATPARLVGSTPMPNAERPVPAAVSSSGKLSTEPRVSEPSLPMTSPIMVRESLMAVPGDPIVNNTGPLGPPEPTVSGEKDSPMRMVGMAMETESPGEEDEGLRSFRMFLQENSRSVPQPPATTPVRERRVRKSL